DAMDDSARAQLPGQRSRAQDVQEGPGDDGQVEGQDGPDQQVVETGDIRRQVPVDQSQIEAEGRDDIRDPKGNTGPVRNEPTDAPAEPGVVPGVVACSQYRVTGVQYPGPHDA